MEALEAMGGRFLQLVIDRIGYKATGWLAVVIFLGIVLMVLSFVWTRVFWPLGTEVESWFGTANIPWGTIGATAIVVLAIGILLILLLTALMWFMGNWVEKKRPQLKEDFRMYAEMDKTADATMAKMRALFESEEFKQMVEAWKAKKQDPHKEDALSQEASAGCLETTKGCPDC